MRIVFVPDDELEKTIGEAHKGSICARDFRLVMIGLIDEMSSSETRAQTVGGFRVSPQWSRKEGFPGRCDGGFGRVAAIRVASVERRSRARSMANGSSGSYDDERVC